MSDAFFQHQALRDIAANIVLAGIFGALSIAIALVYVASALHRLADCYERSHR